jgi:Peptidase family M28
VGDSHGQVIGVTGLVAALAALVLAATAPTPTVDRVDEQAAWSRLVRQVRLGPRPAGSPASRKLAAQLKAELPNGRFQAVPGGLRNVIGFVPGRDLSRTVVVGAHYDTKDLPGFVGANDGGGGTALVVELARTIKPKELRPSVVFILFDGEESPDDALGDFYETGLRGSKVAAPRYKKAEAMILLEFVADRDLSLPREGFSNPALWRKLRAAARRVGTVAVFPSGEQGAVMDDHVPFRLLGVPSIDLIDFDYPCWHRTCDNLSRVSKRSLDAVGETVYELLRSF